MGVDAVERDRRKPGRADARRDDRRHQPEQGDREPRAEEAEQIGPSPRTRDEQDDPDRDDVGDHRLLHPERDRRQKTGCVRSPAMPRRPHRRGDVHEHQHARPGHRADQRPLRQEELGIEDGWADEQRGEDAGDTGPPSRSREPSHAPSDGDHGSDRAHERNQVDRCLGVPEEVGHDPVDPVLNRRFVVPGAGRSVEDRRHRRPCVRRRRTCSHRNTSGARERRERETRRSARRRPRSPSMVPAWLRVHAPSRGSLSSGKPAFLTRVRWPGAPGRSRTHGRRVRSSLLYPLSYGGARRVYLRRFVRNAAHLAI